SRTEEDAVEGGHVGERRIVPVAYDADGPQLTQVGHDRVDEAVAVVDDQDAPGPGRGHQGLGLGGAEVPPPTVPWSNWSLGSTHGKTKYQSRMPTTTTAARARPARSSVLPGTRR